MSKRLLLCAILGLAPGLSSAQGLRAATDVKPVAALASAAVDYIVALVNSEPVTNQEVNERLQRVVAQAEAGLPPREQLLPQVLERLIDERVQLQWAKDLSIKVDDAAVDQAEQNVARKNRLNVAELRQQLPSLGLTPTRFRENLRQELTLERLRERDVTNRVRVSEADIDNHLRERQNTADLSQIDLNLAHVLVRVPENAPVNEVATRQARAEQVARRARAGEDFSALAQEFSDAPERANGGQLGLRSADRYPSLFVESTRALQIGDIAGPLRSPAGFHILKVLEKHVDGLPDTHITQTRARHILLIPGPRLSEEAARARLRDMRQRILSGQARFEDLAREHSQDGSASQGGDLGWATPGQFVPEFEQTMNALAPLQVSEPLVSRFGVHLVQLIERRQVPLSQREQREWLRNILREQKTEAEYTSWLRDLRARAYVEYREPPQ